MHHGEGPEGSGDRLFMHARYDKDGVYLSASEGSKAMLGYGPSELVGTSAYSYFHPEDLAILATSHAEVLSRPETSTATYRIRHRDGHYVTVTSTSVAHRDTVSGEVEIDSVRTLTRLNPQEKQRSVEQEFAYLVERATSMVAVLDDLARILYANPLLERTVSVKFGSLEGASLGGRQHAHRDVNRPTAQPLGVRRAVGRKSSLGGTRALRALKARRAYLETRT